MVAYRSDLSAIQARPARMQGPPWTLGRCHPRTGGCWRRKLPGAVRVGVRPFISQRLRWPSTPEGRLIPCCRSVTRKGLRVLGEHSGSNMSAGPAGKPSSHGLRSSSPSGKQPPTPLAGVSGEITVRGQGGSSKSWWASSGWAWFMLGSLFFGDVQFRAEDCDELVTGASLLPSAGQPGSAPTGFQKRRDVPRRS